MSDQWPAAPDVAGITLSGSEPVVIAPADDAALCRSTGVEPASDGSAHPAWYYVATQLGMGMTVRALCAACQFDVDDGPMMAGTRVTFDGRLMVDVRYDVRGAIRQLLRKRSRQFGVMDLLEYDLSLVAPDGVVVATATNSWVLPRRELA